MRPGAREKGSNPSGAGHKVRGPRQLSFSPFTACVSTLLALLAHISALTCSFQSPCLAWEGGLLALLLPSQVSTLHSPSRPPPSTHTHLIWFGVRGGSKIQKEKLLFTYEECKCIHCHRFYLLCMICFIIIWCITVAFKAIFSSKLLYPFLQQNVQNLNVNRNAMTDWGVLTFS